MIVFLFIDGDDEDGIRRIEELLCETEPFFHHREPLAVAVGIVAVDVVIVVLPVTCAGVVGGIDVDAVDLAGIEVGEELESVEVVRLDEGMPWGGGGSMGEGCDWGEVGVDRFAEFGNGEEVRSGQQEIFIGATAGAESVVGIDGEDGVELGEGTGAASDSGAAADGDIVKWAAFGEVFFKDETEFFLVEEFLSFSEDAGAEGSIRDLSNEVLEGGHIVSGSVRGECNMRGEGKQEKSTGETSVPKSCPE